MADYSKKMIVKYVRDHHPNISESTIRSELDKYKNPDLFRLSDSFETENMSEINKFIEKLSVRPRPSVNLQPSDYVPPRSSVILQPSDYVPPRSSVILQPSNYVPPPPPPRRTINPTVGLRPSVGSHPSVSLQPSVNLQPSIFARDVFVPPIVDPPTPRGVQRIVTTVSDQQNTGRCARCTFSWIMTRLYITKYTGLAKVAPDERSLEYYKNCNSLRTTQLIGDYLIQFPNKSCSTDYHIVSAIIYNFFYNGLNTMYSTFDGTSVDLISKFIFALKQKGVSERVIQQITNIQGVSKTRLNSIFSNLSRLNEMIRDFRYGFTNVPGDRYSVLKWFIDKGYYTTVDYDGHSMILRNISPDGTLEIKNSWGIDNGNQGLIYEKIKDIKKNLQDEEDFLFSFVVLESELDELTRYIKRANDTSKYYIFSNTDVDDIVMVNSEDAPKQNRYVPSSRVSIVPSGVPSGSDYFPYGVPDSSVPNRSVQHRDVFPPSASGGLSDSSNWECPACTTRNLKYDNSCLACETPKPSRSLPIVNKTWRCPKCTFENSNANRNCEMCESPKPFYGGAGVNFDDIFEKVAFSIITKFLRSKTMKQKKTMKQEKSPKRGKSMKQEKPMKKEKTLKK